MTTSPNDVSISNDLIKNSARLIRMRWMAGLAVLIVTPINEYIIGVNLPLLPLYTLGLFILAYNALFWWLLRSRRIQLVTVGQVALDWLALTVLVHLTGGVESLATHFFLFYILLAPILLPERSVPIFVASVILAVVGVIGLEAAGVLVHYRVRPSLPPNLHLDPRYIAAKLTFFITVSLVTAALMIPIVHEFRERERQIMTLYQNMQALSRSLDVSHVLKRLAVSATRALQAKGTLIWLVDKDAADSQMRIAAGYGLSKDCLSKVQIPCKLCTTNIIPADGQPLVIEDVAREEDLQPSTEFLAEGIRSILAVPLVGHSSPLGVLQVYARQPGYFTEKECQFATAIAQQATTAIENALTYEELRRADETKSQFVRAVTHELRSPVGAAQSLLRSMMFEEDTLNDELREDLHHISDRLDALKMLIDDLLDLAAGKVEGMESELEPVSLEAAIYDVIEQLSSQAEEKNIALKMNRVPFGITVIANADGLKRIFTNLIGNAIKYTPEGGHVRVTIKRQNGEAKVDVTDTGIGIHEKDIPRLFEEFFRARNAKETGIVGTGLGLSIVKDLVDHYGGHISVQSTVGGGSTFTISLPFEQ